MNRRYHQLILWLPKGKSIILIKWIRLLRMTINWGGFWNSKERFWSILFCFYKNDRNYVEINILTRFDCILDETDQECGGTMTYQLFYFLQDDTVSIKELPENQEGRDHFPMLLRKTKLPKNWKAKPSLYLFKLFPQFSVHNYVASWVTELVKLHKTNHCLP